MNGHKGPAARARAAVAECAAWLNDQNMQPVSELLLHEALYGKKRLDSYKIDHRKNS